ncbi:MAG: hypothetical protein ABL891_22185 [Burkholderiales bacterium]
MVYPPLLIVACLFGMYEQKVSPEEQPPQCEAETLPLPADVAPRVTSIAVLDRNKTADA